MRDRSRFLSLLLFAAALPALADFQAGLDAYQKGDYVGAAKEWRPLAEQGSADRSIQPRASSTSTAMAFRKAPPKPPIGSGERRSRTTRRPSTTWAPCTAPGQGVKRDYIQAYKWLNICAAKGNAGCVTQRDLIAKKLKPAQVAEAQRLATEFKPQKESAKAVDRRSPPTANSQLANRNPGVSTPPSPLS